MVKTLAPLLIFISTWGCAQRDFSQITSPTDSTYGYTNQNPLKMKSGNVGRSIGYSYDFLLGLRTVDDQSLKFVERVSVDNPKYKSKRERADGDSTPAHDEGGQLDKYTFVTSRNKDTVVIYVDVYHRGQLKIPVGLKYQ